MKSGLKAPVVNAKLKRGISSDVNEDDPTAKAMFVAVRIRPLSESEKASHQSSCCEVIDGRVVAIRKNGSAGEYLKSQSGSLHEYGFDAAFGEKCGQHDVYSGTAKPFLGYILSGLNVTVFAYGATGAGIFIPCYILIH